MISTRLDGSQSPQRDAQLWRRELSLYSSFFTRQTGGKPFDYLHDAVVSGVISGICRLDDDDKVGDNSLGTFRISVTTEMEVGETGGGRRGPGDDFRGCEATRDWSWAPGIRDYPRGATTGKMPLSPSTQGRVWLVKTHSGWAGS